MKLEVWAIGKTSRKYLDEGIDYYHQKLRHYIPFDYIEIPESKLARSMDKSKSLKMQSELILSKISSDDYLVLLDEKGKTYSSLEFASYLNRFLLSSYKRVLFLIGGAYGFHENIYAAAKEKISLSSMTLTHDMVRLFALEQIYRGCSILKNEPYHNQ